jgi:hypothetical protein
MAKPHSGIVRSDSRPPNFTPLTHCVLLGRVVILRSSEARVFRPIDSLARRQNVTFSNLYGLGSKLWTWGVLPCVTVSAVLCVIFRMSDVQNSGPLWTYFVIFCGMER